jgi:hypothetical protein
MPLKDLRKLALAIVMVAASNSTANADFLDDLFGGSDPIPHAAATGRAMRRHYDPASRVRSPRREFRVKSEVHFMPVARHQRLREGRITTVAKSEDGGSSTGSKPIAAALCASETTVSSTPATGLLAYDKTLRSGDIMMTDAGLRIFRGHSGCPHDARDYIALSSVKMTRGRRNMLLAIEDARHSSHGPMAATKLNSH